MGIPYGEYFDDRDCRVSVDMLRIRFTYKNTVYDFGSHEAVLSIDKMSFFLDRITKDYDIVWFYCNSFKAGRYCRLATLTFDNGSTATFMIGRYAFNSACKNVEPEIVAEFNPNKVPYDLIRKILFGLAMDAWNAKIMRFDLAFDIPVRRDRVQLQTVGRRGHRQFDNNLLDNTEYLGERHSHGAVKLYNKTIESGLSYDLTRLEITIHNDEFNLKMFPDLIPDLYVSYDYQMDMGFADLPFEVQACILHPDLVPILKQSKTGNTWRKYKSQIDSFSGVHFQVVDFAGIYAFLLQQFSRFTDISKLAG